MKYLLVVFLAVAPAFAAKDFNSNVDMVEYMGCGAAHRAEYQSDRGLVVGLSYTNDDVESASKQPDLFGGMTLYACPKGDWIWFNPENQSSLNHFGIKKSYLKNKCKGVPSIFVTEVWAKEPQNKKFGARIQCAAIEKLLK